MIERSIDEWRSVLVTQLEQYLLRWPTEQPAIERIIEFVNREAGCFDRTTQEGHITGAAWLVDQSDMEVLLTHHRKLGKWLQLGGHTDGDGNVFRVAHQEAQEESGIQSIVPISAEIFDADVHSIPAHGNIPEHLHFDIRFAFRAQHRDYIVSHESHDLAWVPIQSMSDYTTEDSLLRMVQKWQSLVSSRL